MCQVQPFLCVATPQAVYIYKVFKAHYQFKIPKLPMLQSELNIWTKFDNLDLANISQFVEALTLLKQSGTQLSWKSLEVSFLINVRFSPMSTQKNNCNLLISIEQLGLKLTTAALALTS
jgi:hypothetical protein